VVDPLRMAHIDRAVLTAIVRRARLSTTAEVLDWSQTQIKEGMSGGEVYRFAGQGQENGVVFPWSLIYKIIRAPTNPKDPADLAWKREVLAYQAGLLDNLPGKLRAPCCFEVVEPSPAEVSLWQEDVVDGLEEWPLSRYGLAARHLGEFNGAYLTGRPLPDQTWLHRGWLRSSADRGLRGLQRVLVERHHPLVSRVNPPDTISRLEQLVADHLVLLDAIFDRLPLTFCHLDSNRRNLFAGRSAEGEDETVAIDWGQAGLDPVGIDLACLVHSSLIWRFRGKLDQATELDKVAFEGYLQGLDAAGWRQDPRLVRFAFTAITAIHYAVRGNHFQLYYLLDESRHDSLEQLFGCSVAEVCDHWATLQRFYLDLTEEARILLGKGWR